MQLSQQTLLITGITGLVGFRTAEMALQRGMRVKGLVRSPAKAAALKDLGVEIVLGDITDPEAAAIACAGVDVVLHTAAIVEADGDPQQFQQVNVGGAVTMAKAAQAAGAFCFVHLSSVMVYGFTFPDAATETAPLRGEQNPYCQAKIDSELALLRLNHPPEFGVIIIRPGDIYGPRATAWVTGVLERMRQKELMLPNWGKGKINPVYIDNLVDGIFLAIEQEAYGEIFNLTDGHDITTAEFFGRLATIANLPKPIALSTSMVRFLFKLYLLKEKLQGRSPTLQAASIDFLCRPHRYSIEKAQRVLGYNPKISSEEGMRLTQAWLEQHWLRP